MKCGDTQLMWELVDYSLLVTALLAYTPSVNPIGFNFPILRQYVMNAFLGLRQGHAVSFCA